MQYNPPKDSSLVNPVKVRTTKNGEKVDEKTSSGGSLETGGLGQQKWSPLSSLLAGAAVDMVLHYALGRKRTLPKKCVNF